MAPKRGGGSSSGGSSSSSGGSSSYGGSSSGGSGSRYNYRKPTPFWLQKIPLGSFYNRSYAMAYLVMVGIATLVIFGVLVASGGIKGKRQSGRKHFRWYAWGLAVVALLIHFFLLILDLSLIEAKARVARIYIIERILQNFFSGLSNIALLGVIYAIVRTRIRQTSLGSASLYDGVKTVHGLLIGALTGVFLLFIGFYTAYLVSTEGTTLGGSSWSAHKYTQTLTAWVVVYFVASLEVLVWAAVTVGRPGQDKASKRVGILLLAHVAAPLLIHSVYELAMTVKYTLPAEDAPRVPAYARATDIVFSLAPLVLTYIGVLFIGLTKGGPAGGPDRAVPGGMAYVGGPADPQKANGVSAATPAPQYGHASSPPPMAGGHTSLPPPMAGGHTSLPPPPAGTQWVLAPVMPVQPQQQWVAQPVSQYGAPAELQSGGQYAPPPNSTTTASSPPVSTVSPASHGYYQPPSHPPPATH
ncbi:MAG: hypothetical protein M1832_001511 [Thelocarpon impressellum]|nr:MAG: hypothetical protein M1832_001511 [Thelocarpon impressellum]